MRHIADPSSVAEPDPAVREEVTQFGRPIVEVVRTDVEVDRAEALSLGTAHSRLGQATTPPVSSLRSSPASSTRFSSDWSRFSKNSETPDPH